jgi:hypothetical protein
MKTTRIKANLRIRLQLMSGLMLMVAQTRFRAALLCAQEATLLAQVVVVVVVQQGKAMY